MSDDDVPLTVKEYADQFRISVQTVYSSIRRGQMKWPVVRPTQQAIRIIVPRESIPSIPSLNL